MQNQSYKELYFRSNNGLNFIINIHQYNEASSKITKTLNFLVIWRTSLAIIAFNSRDILSKGSKSLKLLIAITEWVGHKIFPTIGATNSNVVKIIFFYKNFRIFLTLWTRLFWNIIWKGYISVVKRLVLTSSQVAVAFNKQ